MKGITMRNSWILAGCLAALLPACGQNSQPPSARRAAFAGTWRLDLKKSYMGSDHPDASYGFTKTFELKGSTIAQKDHEVNIDIVGMALPERNSSAELVPDGQEHTIQAPSFFPGMPPTPMHITVEWQGDNLVVQESGQSFIGPVSNSRRYFLSEDGTELIEIITGRTSFGDSEQRLVFARVADSH
jgi:hypothetical protein